VIMFPRGAQHIWPAIPIGGLPIQDVYSQPATEQIAVVKYGGAPSAIDLGFLHADQRFVRC